VSEVSKFSLRDHDALHHELVERLVADLRPVRRLWPLSLRLALWITLEVAVLLLIIAHTHRTDLAQKTHDLWYTFGVVGFGVAGVIAAYFALRASIPGREVYRSEVVLLVIVTLVSSLLLLHQPSDARLPLSQFITVGRACALSVLMFASLPWFALLWAVKRAAPLSPALDGALIGAAAFLCSFALMRVNCPIDDGLHLFIWHFLPAVVGVALSAGAGMALFRRQRR